MLESCIEMMGVKKIKTSPLEEEILNVAKKLTKKGQLSIKELYWSSISQLKHDSYKVSQAIYQLIMKNYIAKKIPLTKDSVLENDIRSKIFIYITNFPGSNFMELQNNLKIPAGQIAFHLKMLMEFEYIRTNKIEEKIFYFDVGINPKYDRLILALKSTYNFKILEIILLNPKIGLINLASKANMEAGIVKDILKKLLELNFISEMKEAKEHVFIGNIQELEPLFKILKVPKSKMEKYEESQKTPAKKEEIKFLEKGKKYKKKSPGWQ